jgi:hypothetical protein
MGKDNNAKQTDGLSGRIIGNVSAFTMLQYLDNIHNGPIDPG